MNTNPKDYISLQVVVILWWESTTPCRTGNVFVAAVLQSARWSKWLRPWRFANYLTLLKKRKEKKNSASRLSWQGWILRFSGVYSCLMSLWERNGFECLTRSLNKFLFCFHLALAPACLCRDDENPAQPILRGWSKTRIAPVFHFS